MNVSKEADAAFMRELQESDPQRYARLQKNMLKGRAVKSGWIVGTCTRCHGQIYNAPFLSASEPHEFCSRDCRDKPPAREQDPWGTALRGLLGMRSEIFGAAG